MKRIFITSHSSISALGSGCEEPLNSLRSNKDCIHYPEKSEKFKLPYFPVNIESKSGIANKCSILALKLLSLIEDSWLKNAPVPLFISTSTGGIRETEDNYTNLSEKKSSYPLLKNHFLNCIQDDIKKIYKDKIKSYFTISTACSSSAQAVYKAFQYLQNGIFEKALVIGVDSLSLTTMVGFDSLKLVSHTRTMPLSVQRDGLSLGEGAGILLLETDPQAEPQSELLGASSTSDAYHISSPDPEGIQQALCIKEAVKGSGVGFGEVDYINAHGTGTPMNDEVEMKVIKDIFPESIIVTSLKGFIGHTLGASAVTEISIVLNMLKTGMIYQKMDEFTPMDNKYIPSENIKKNVNIFIKNSFGFGGNNVSLVFKNLNNRSG